MDLSIRIAGAAGQGVETMGELLNDAFAGLGVHVFTSQVYMSRIRGGLNWFDIRIADFELFSAREKPDLLVALRPEAVDLLASELEAGGQILFNGKEGAGVIAIDFEGVAKELTKSAVMANTVAAGAVMEVLGYDLAPLFARLEATFLKKKGPQVVADNIACATRGAELARPYAGKLRRQRPSARRPTRAAEARPSPSGSPPRERSSWPPIP